MALAQPELNKAVTLLGKGSYEEALAAYSRIDREELTRYEQCVVLLGEKKCLECLGRFEEAEQTLQRIQQLDDSGEFHIFLESGFVDLLYARGDYDDFVKRANALLKKHREELKRPEYENVLHTLEMNIPLALISLGKFQEGIVGLRQFLPNATKEDKSDVHLFLGIAHEQLGEHDAAIAEFETVLSLKNNENTTAQAHYRLGAHYMQAKSPQQAKRHLLAAENLKHALGNIPLRDLYIFLANATGQLGEENERKRYLQLANIN